MIRKLRLKFVGICMLLVTCVLAVVFASMYASAQRAVGQVGQETLERVLTQAANPGAGRLPSAPAFGGSVPLPYFTVEVWSRGSTQTVYVTGGTYADLQDSEALQSIMELCLAQGETQGTIESYDLRYLRQDLGLFQRIAFVDISMELSTLHQLLRAYLQIGLGALALLLGVSVLLSWWVTRPVELAWRQQHQFLSDASHELKTPLTVILSNAELLESAALDQKPGRWVDNIHSEALRMKSLVEEMLTLARADHMVRTSVFGSVCLSDLAGDCVLAFEPVAYDAGKPLRDEIAPGVFVTGDGEKLRQALGVLLDNAIKYGRSGAAITLSVQKTERQARITVRNENAAGPIPPEQLGRLFERFYRADASRGEQTGFGLGLPIAAAIAAEHKGAIRAESDAAATRFILTLPLSKPPAAAPAQK